VSGRGAPTVIGIVVAALLGGVAVSACGTTDKASRETLPPIRTTIAITTTTSTTVPAGQRFYEIKPGETLGIIAASFQVTVQSIVDLNGLANPDDIQAGQTIEIPSDITVIADLPEAPPPTTTG
jgi:LysM repeat protein